MLNIETLIQAIDDAGYEAVPYSGRGMFGRQCVAIKSNERTLRVLSDIVQQCSDVDLATDIVRGAMTDSLGLNEVIYWPSARITENAE